MTANACNSNVQMSAHNDLENAFTVSTVVANITAFLLQRQSRKVRGRRHQICTSRRTRHFRVRKRRSVEDIYNELGPMYFRRAYRMHYSTFKALADELCHYIINASEKKEDQEGSFQMVQSAQMSGLPVQFDGFKVHQHMIS